MTNGDEDRKQRQDEQQRKHYDREHVDKMQRPEPWPDPPAEDDSGDKKNRQ